MVNTEFTLEHCIFVTILLCGPLDTEYVTGALLIVQAGHFCYSEIGKASKAYETKLQMVEFDQVHRLQNLSLDIGIYGIAMHS